MPRFKDMLLNGFRERGHIVEVYTAEARFFNLPVPSSLKKWMGYIDQFILFPSKVKKLIKNNESDTLYVFTDHALGMWVPIVKNLPHVIICHDFLAQQSALGTIPQNPTGWSGRIYQRLIRNGYSKGKNFISVSKKTQQDLHNFLSRKPQISEVIYNGLNQKFEPTNDTYARTLIGKKIGLDLTRGYILHVGGNQWYKNRIGVVEIYDEWRRSFNGDLPLLLIGFDASEALKDRINRSPYRGNIYILANPENEFVKLAYSGASLLLFPSIAEGFGWPIAEAMASGCPVITTGCAPMTEVGGDAAIYIGVKPIDETEVGQWAKESAILLNSLLCMPHEERLQIIAKGLNNAKRFSSGDALNQMENLFKKITIKSN